MKRFLMAIAMAGIWPALSFAHDGDNGRFGRGGSGYDSRSRGGYGDPAGSALRDLERIASRSRVDGHERDHFRNALKDLARFQDRARDGRFDEGKLENAIEHMEHLADARQVHPRDRQIIRGHVARLNSLLRGGYRGRW